MFKKSSWSNQFDIFTSPKSLFSGNSLKMYEDEYAWHNQFRKQVTMRIDEDIFRPLYCLNNGTKPQNVCATARQVSNMWEFQESL